MAQLPAYLQKVSGRYDPRAAKAGIGSAQPPRVSIAGNRFTLVEADGAEQMVTTMDKNVGIYLDAVIVGIDASNNKIYYAEQFTPNQENYTPPACTSSDGVRPDQGVPEPQAELCSTCPQNVWGSKITPQGKSSKACQDGKKIVLFVDGKGFYTFRITPGSFRNWSSFISLLEGQGYEPQFVVTRITFASQGVLAFTAVNFVSEQLMHDSDQPDAVKALMKNEAPMQLAGPAPTIFTAGKDQVADRIQIMPFQTPPVQPDTFGGMKPNGNPPRKRRTKAEMEASRAQEAGLAAQYGTTVAALDAAVTKPAFGMVQKPVTPMQEGGMSYPPHGADKPTFGMQQPQVNADPDLSAAIAAAFAVET